MNTFSFVVAHNIVESLVYSRRFCLLIIISIYKNVHLGEWISKMVVANFTSSLRSRSKVNNIGYMYNGVTCI